VDIPTLSGLDIAISFLSLSQSLHWGVIVEAQAELLIL